MKPLRRPCESAPRKLDALAMLPLFFTLQGRRVVVAGGTEAAAWKAELLAAAGAHVEVFAPHLCAQFQALLVRGAAAGQLSHRPRPWDGSALSNAALAVCDAASEGEAQAFACAGRAAGVPVNVIDKPDHCAVQFGSIVNRSPVVVGISTAGAAPILGQAIRRRIETVLPPTLIGWARLASSVRASAMAHLSPGPQRRRFWERFADAAFRGPAPHAVDDLLSEAATHQGRGKVTLVGAGPGDASLLTLAAVRSLQACDVILFDDLVSDDVLELARREAKRIAVGKRGARQSCRQDDITALMVELAGQGRHVVRLKSGDPMIFGRAGEEIAALERAGIETGVGPGVTCACAMAARLKVSLTHRDHAHALTLLTGHSRHGGLPSALDVASVMGEGRSAVVYMGALTCRTWVDRALAAGVAATTPAAAMTDISRPGEHTWQGMLIDLPDNLPTNRSGPILIGVGAVFATDAAGMNARPAHNEAPTPCALGVV